MNARLLMLSTSPEPQVAGGTLAEAASRFVPYSRQMRQLVRRRPRGRDVDVGCLLIGPQNGKDAIALAGASGTLAWGSTAMVSGPHVELLTLAADHAGILSDEDILGSSYVAFARAQCDIGGDWFGATTDEELVDLSRNFIEWARGRSRRVTARGGSPFDDHILVAAVSDSPMFQVIDGHHRVAAAIARGDETLHVHRTWFDVETPLQARLTELDDPLSGGRTLRQPLPAAEVQSGWTVAMNCSDRLLRMLAFLEHRVPDDEPRTYLDVGSSYGWFLEEMARFGYESRGIEPDAGAPQIGASFFGVDPRDVLVGDATEGVEGIGGVHGVVSCFAMSRLLAPGWTGHEASRLVKGLDRITAHVLFVDSDVRLERRDARLSHAPTAHSLTELILDNTSFCEAHDLGANHDPFDRASASSNRLLAFVR